jgi:putative acetyltransferase
METSSIRVRREEPEDADAMARLLGDEGVYPLTLQLPHVSRQFWRERLARYDPAKYALVAEVDGDIVGSAGLFINERPRQRHCAMLGISVATDHAGRGVGSALMRELLRAADGWLNLLRVELTVYTDNERAIRLYEKFGFAIEGTLRAGALRDGVYVDSHLMARLHPNPPQLPRA